MKKLRLFIKEHMEVLWIGIATAFLAASYGFTTSYVTRDTTAFSLPLVLLAVGSLLAAVVFYFVAAREIKRKEREEWEKRKTEMGAFQRFLEMSKPESGSNPIYASEANQRAEEKKRNAKT